MTLEALGADKCYLYFSTPWLNVNATKTLTCNSSSKTWDYKINGASFDVSTDADLTCTVTKTAASTSQTFAQYIASLAGTTQGTGQVVNENGYRYEGKDPNNYIWFNNEMWRIIGVFGSSRHGVTNDPKTINSVSDTYLVKIIRNSPLSKYAWNAKSGASNNWPTSSLYYLLNGCYFYALNATDTTNISGSSVACSNYCICNFYSSTINPRTHCDFRVLGLQKTDKYFGYRDMVQEATWYLGGSGKTGYDDTYPADVYGYETNSNAIYSGNSTSITANVGLMYVSDYGYSVLASSCARGSNDMFSDYKSESCSGNSWLFSQGDEWTISHYSSGNYASWYLDDGYIGNKGCVDGNIVRPVVYLKSKTYKLAGNGSVTNPYVIGMTAG